MRGFVYLVLHECIWGLVPIHSDTLILKTSNGAPCCSQRNPPRFLRPWPMLLVYTYSTSWLKCAGVATAVRLLFLHIDSSLLSKVCEKN